MHMWQSSFPRCVCLPGTETRSNSLTQKSEIIDRIKKHQSQLRTPMWGAPAANDSWGQWGVFNNISNKNCKTKPNWCKTWLTAGLRPDRETFGSSEVGDSALEPSWESGADLNLEPLRRDDGQHQRRDDMTSAKSKAYSKDNKYTCVSGGRVWGEELGVMGDKLRHWVGTRLTGALKRL